MTSLLDAFPIFQNIPGYRPSSILDLLPQQTAQPDPSLPPSLTTPPAWAGPWVNAGQSAPVTADPTAAPSTSNPVTDYLASHQNALQNVAGQIGSVAGASNLHDALVKFSGAGGGTPQAVAADRSYAVTQQQQKTQQQALAAGQQQQSATINWLKQKGYDDLVAAANGGAPMSEVWNAAMKRSNPSGDGSDPAAIQEYNLYKQQTVAAGGTPMPYLDFKQSTAGGGSAGTDDDAQSIGDAIIAGQQPPDVKGLYKLSGPVRAYLASKGYDYTKANEDWTATQKLLGTMNGAQQTRLRQSVQQVSDSLDVVDQLASQWQGNNWPILNKVNLVAAANGAPGYTSQQQSLATQLVAEIGDVTSDLGTVYKGGNSSTDESLKLAAQQLNASWSADTLHNAIALAKRNIAMRSNSLQLATAGVDNSQYNPMTPTPMAPANVGPAGVTAGAPTASQTGDPDLDQLLTKYGTQ